MSAFDFILHINEHLDTLSSDYGVFVYVFLFVIIFLETGVVVTPFLPGDSLLFAAGALAAIGGVNVFGVTAIVLVAAIGGDTVNYFIGRKFGEATLVRFPRIVKPHYLSETHRFFEKYGAKTIVIARFVPIVRTIAPFIAGAGDMTYRTFFRYNVIGACVWVFVAVFAGYFFGNLPFVRDNFTLVVFAIILTSLIPPFVEVWRARRRSRVQSDL